jgi:hypothetical protein
MQQKEKVLDHNSKTQATKENMLDYNPKIEATKGKDT